MQNRGDQGQRDQHPHGANRMSWLAEHAFSERSLGIAWKKVQKRESDDGNLAPSILKFQEDAEE